MTKSKSTTAENFIDPICGMTVEPKTAAGSFNHDGITYYFCSAGCMQKFIAEKQGAPASGLVGIRREKSDPASHGDMKATAGGSLINRSFSAFSRQPKK